MKQPVARFCLGVVPLIKLVVVDSRRRFRGKLWGDLSESLILKEQWKRLLGKRTASWDPDRLRMIRVEVIHLLVESQILSSVTVLSFVFSKLLKMILKVPFCWIKHTRSEFLLHLETFSIWETASGQKCSNSKEINQIVVCGITEFLHPWRFLLRADLS